MNKKPEFNLLILLLSIVISFAPAKAFAFTYEESQNLLQLLKNKEFEQLENNINKYFDLFAKDNSNDLSIDQLLETFDTHIPSLQEPINEWLESAPNSYVPYLINALHNHRLGWEARGGKYIDKTTNKEIDKMSFYFNISNDNFIKALQLKKDLVHAYAYLINIRMNYGDSATIRKIYDQGMKINRLSHRLHLFYSFSLKPVWGGSLKEMEQFSKEMDLLSKENPRLKALTNIVDIENANTNHKAKKYNLAITAYSKAEKIGGYWYLYHNMGDAYLDLKDLKQASDYYKKLVNLRPSFSTGNYKLALTYLHMRKPKDALKYAERSKTLDPFNADNYSLLTYINYNLGKLKEAKTTLDTAIELSPNDPKLKGLLKTLNNKMNN